ncbi:MAG: hypothetical protein K1060chlam2_01554 [Chlamydiae bacterium]|nr:hypothetical protein [Chlamydiota bacterium]
MEVCKRFCFLIILLCSSTLSAYENHNGEDEVEIVVLPSHAVVNNDYFAYGRTIEISGTVNGDVYVFGGQVFIDGTVNGDIIACAGSIEISGRVSHDVRLLAGQASISGHIGRNLTAVTATIELYPSAVIGNNAVIVSGNADIEARIKNDVRLYASSVRISNQIDGDVIAYVGQMRITSKANILGKMEYWSNKNALIDSDAHIAKGVKHHPSFFYKLFHGKLSTILKVSSKLAALLMNFFYSFIIGLIMIRYFRRRIDRTIDALNNKPLQSLIAGVVLIVLLPITFLALIVTILGVPFALTLLSLTVVTFYTAKILSIIWVSKLIFYRFDFKRHIRLYFAFGLIIYFLLTLIPYFGTALSLAALLLGLGGGMLGKIEKQKRSP